MPQRHGRVQGIAGKASPRVSDRRLVAPCRAGDLPRSFWGVAGRIGRVRHSQGRWARLTGVGSRAARAGGSGPVVSPGRAVAVRVRSSSSASGRVPGRGSILFADRGLVTRTCGMNIRRNGVRPAVTVVAGRKRRSWCLAQSWTTFTRRCSSRGPLIAFVPSVGPAAIGPNTRLQRTTGNMGVMALGSSRQARRAGRSRRIRSVAVASRASRSASAVAMGGRVGVRRAGWRVPVRGRARTR